jgi:hypothetical protein
MINEKAFELLAELNRKHWLGMNLQNPIHFGRSGNEDTFDSLIEIEIDRLNLLKDKETNEPRKKAIEQSLELMGQLKVMPKDKAEKEEGLEKALEKLKKLEMTKEEIQELKHLEYLQKEGGLTEEQQERLDELKRKRLALEEKWQEILKYDGISPSELVELQEKYNINENGKLKEPKPEIKPSVGISVVGVQSPILEVPRPPEKLKFGRADGIYKVPETKEEYKKTGDAYEYTIKGNKADQIKTIQQMVDHFVENGGKEAELKGTDKDLLHIACFRLQEHGITKIKLPDGIEPPMIQAPPRLVK